MSDDSVVCRLSYRSLEGIEIFNRRDLLLRYLKTWFVIDFLSVLPFQLLQMKTDSALLVLRGYKLSKLTRLLKYAAEVCLGVLLY
jgi:hypothetical protein